MSSNKNAWDYDEGPSWAGMLIGYAIFLTAYLFVVVVLFYDVLSKIKEYDQLIADDIDELKRNNFDVDSEEVKEALKNRLAGIKEEDAGDDQLLAEAAKLEKENYEKYLRKD